MQIIIKATHFDLTSDLQAFIDQKFQSLEKFIQRFDRGSVELRLEIGKPSEHHKAGKVFYAEATLDLPGKVLRASELDYDVLLAIEKVRQELKRQIEKYKGARIKNKE